MTPPIAFFSRPSGRLLLALLAAVVVLAAACGGGSSHSTSASTTTLPGAGGGLAAARARFVTCLEQHGVPASQAIRGFGFRRGGQGAGSTSSGTSPPGSASAQSPPASPPTTNAAYLAAFQACRSELPATGRSGLFNSATGRAYLQCLQLHGVTVPSTAPGTSTGSGGGFGAITANPNFQSARAACASLAPNRSGGTSGGSTSSTSAAA